MPGASITERLRARLLAAVLDMPHGCARESLSDLRGSQWSAEFETLMRNRLLMGRYRYGAMRDQGQNGYDNIGSTLRRLRLYRDTGNLEHLVDAANLCLVEFVTGAHPDMHFEASDDGEHAELI